MVGRKQETQELNNIFYSGKAELVAIYGRRRIGKTYLVDETFKNRITFRHAGLSPVEEGSKEGNSLKNQLEHFYFSLQLQGMPKSHRSQSWLEAFFMLEQLLQTKDNGERQIIFLDELPWLDPPGSVFITAFEGFWNTWACHLSKYLKALIASDFVIEYVPFGLGKRETHYKLVDSFCKLWLKFVNEKENLDSAFWQPNVTSNQINSWRGFAFENVCFNHIKQIKSALGISGVITTHSAWSKRPDEAGEKGAQIDLLISRNDNVVNMCEMKFYSEEFSVNKDYHETLVKRQNLLSTMIPKKSVVHGTLITTYGLTYNEYSGDFINTITMEDLFKD